MLSNVKLKRLNSHNKRVVVNQQQNVYLAKFIQPNHDFITTIDNCISVFGSHLSILAPEITNSKLFSLSINSYLNLLILSTFHKVFLLIRSHNFNTALV
jgi:hypothetical protein